MTKQKLCSDSRGKSGAAAVTPRRRKASECTLLTVFEIEGIPSQPAGRPQIRVTLSIDAGGSMTVTAVDRDNDVVLAEETVEVTPAYSVSPSKDVHAAGSPSPDKHGERRAGYR